MVYMNISDGITLLSVMGLKGRINNGLAYMPW